MWNRNFWVENRSNRELKRTCITPYKLDLEQKSLYYSMLKWLKHRIKNVSFYSKLIMWHLLYCQFLLSLLFCSSLKMLIEKVHETSVYGNQLEWIARVMNAENMNVYRKRDRMNKQSNWSAFHSAHYNDWFHFIRCDPFHFTKIQPFAKAFVT